VDVDKSVWLQGLNKGTYARLKKKEREKSTQRIYMFWPKQAANNSLY